MIATVGTYPVPSGLSLRSFQRDGVQWLLDHPNSLVADEMGTGKTPTCCVFLNCVRWDRVLIVVPASLRLNWRNELRRWLVKDARISVIWDGKAQADGDIVICSYDLLHRRPDLLAVPWTICIADEAHYIKGKSTKRTRAVLEIKTERMVFVTGSPLVNRPVEVWNMAHRCDKTIFPNYWQFVRRYCDAHDNGFGYDVSGASNCGELQQKLKSFMIRRLKKDVLADLPPKTRQLIELPPTKEMKQVLDRENAAWSLHEDTLAQLAERRDRAAITGDDLEHREACRLLKAAYTVAFAEMSTVRKETAIAKISICISHIKDVLEQVQKVVIFAHHRAVVSELLSAFPSADYGTVCLVGDTPQQERQANIERFQTVPECRVFVASIQAAGVGITLTAASTAIFCEADWVPANLSQAEDRLHRIGARSAVLIQHLVLEGSLDAKMLKTVVAKQEVLDDCLDVEPGSSESHQRVVRRKVNYAEIGAKLDVYQRGAIIKALGILAGQDGDKARSRNNSGFSRFDSNIGHELSKMQELSDGRAGYGQCLVRRYRRQLDPVLCEACGVTSD